MLSLRFNAAILGILLLSPGLGSAQPVAPGNGGQSMDMRVGVARPLDVQGNLTDGGIRTPPSPALVAVPMVSLGKDYRIGPNDLIDVDVLDMDSLKRTVRVNAAGAISLPLIGSVSVAGLTSQEVENRIADRYREKYLQDPQVSIFIKEFTTERITIEGAVARPGVFPMTGRLTLLRALALAGGFGYYANTSKVMLYRLNEQQVREMAVYDVENIRAGKSGDPPIQGDDLIVVQRDSARVMLKDSLFRDVLDTLNPFSVLAPH